MQKAINEGRVQLNINYLVHILSDNTELNFGRISISVGELEVFVNKGLKILFLVFLMFISIKIYQADEVAKIK